jgi:hypothetical protein
MNIFQSFDLIPFLTALRTWPDPHWTAAGARGVRRSRELLERPAQG